MKENNKKSVVITRVIQAVAFLLALFTILSVLSVALFPKDNSEESGLDNTRGRGFYSEPKNSIDVLFLGNSDAGSGFSPLELWNEYGYSSFVCSAGRLKPAGMYQLFEEFLTCQKPKVLVVETDGFFYDGNPLGLVKNAIDMKIDTKLPVFKYHNKWKSTTPSTMFCDKEYTAEDYIKGQLLCTVKVKCKEVNYLKYTQKSASVPLVNDYYIDKILDLAKENNIVTYFAEVPSASSWTYERHNGMEKYAKKKNIKFYDLDFDKKKFKFNWYKDTIDMGNHLNIYGAKKVTKYFGQFLNQNNVLTDHRGDSNYSNWDKYYKMYYDAYTKTGEKNIYSEIIEINNESTKKKNIVLRRNQKKLKNKNKKVAALS